VRCLERRRAPATDTLAGRRGVLSKVSAWRLAWLIRSGLLAGLAQGGKSLSLFNVGRGPTGVIKSVLDTERSDGGRRDEIFVDIVEKISCTFNPSGYLQASSIDGAIVVRCRNSMSVRQSGPSVRCSSLRCLSVCRSDVAKRPGVASSPCSLRWQRSVTSRCARLQVKSYLAGNPAIKLALNEDLAIGRHEGASVAQQAYGGGADMVMLDDANFYEGVSLERFESERLLELVPPDGEFALMSYRCARPGSASPGLLQKASEMLCQRAVHLVASSCCNA
jgi:Adaptor complexes medium subunit family